jgi:hypothetical protein
VPWRVEAIQRGEGDELSIPRLLEPFPLEWDAQQVVLIAGGWPPIRGHRTIARSAAEPRFVTVV